MIKNILVSLLTICALACGGVPDDDAPGQVCIKNLETGENTCADIEDQDAGETGYAEPEVEKALVVDNGYGAEADANVSECYVPWGGSKCLIPKGRGFKVNINCSSTKQGVCVSINRAYLTWANDLQTRGFTVSEVTPGTRGLNVTVVTGVVGTSSSDGALGVAAANYLTSDAVPGPGGNYERVFLCQVALDMEEIYAALATNRSIYPTVPTQAQKENAYYNAAMHELGHCAGFGHHDTAPPYNIMAQQWPNMFSALDYSSLQKTWLSNYHEL